MTAHRKDRFRQVVEAKLCEDHTGRYWFLVLECGHEETRRVMYRKTAKQAGWGGDRTKPVRSLLDIRPAPQRVRCEECGPEDS